MNVFADLFITFLCSIGAGVVTYLIGSRLVRSQPDPSPSPRAGTGEVVGNESPTFFPSPLVRGTKGDLEGERESRWGIADHLLCKGTGSWGRSPHAADRAVVVMALAYMLVFGSLSVSKYYALASPGTDLAQYDQLVWNTLHGRILENTIVRDAHLFLAKTFTPILLAFVPLYALWSNAVVLLLVQTVALGLGGLPIYWFARERLGPRLGLILAATYYLSPALGNMNLDDFHEITLAVPLLALALYFLMRCRYKPFLVTLAVTFLVKEEIAIIALALGVFILFFQKAKALGIALAAFSGLFIWVVLEYVIPFFRGSEPGSFYYLPRYGYLGQTVAEILHTSFTRPDIVFQHLLVPGKIEYVLQLLVPLAFVPLVGIEIFALTVPTFGYTLLSDVSWQYSIQSAYPAPLLPLLFFAAVLGLQRLSTWGGLSRQRLGENMARQWALGAVMLTAGVLSYYLQAQGPLARYFQSQMYALNADTFVKERWMQSIPRDAVVVAENEFLAHVSGRQFVYEIPSIPDCRQVDYLIADPGERWFQVHQSYWVECLGSGYFDIAAQLNGFMIAKPRVPDRARVANFGTPLTLLAYTVQPDVKMVGGMTLQPILLIRPNDATWTKYRVVIQVVDAQGHVWSRDDRAPGKLARTDQRQVGKLMRDQYRLDLPPTIPTGEYQITVAVHPADGEDSIQAVDDHGNSLGTELVLTTVQIEKNKSSVTASELKIEQPHQADMQELRLLGYVPPRETITAGELLQVGLYWRARAQPRGDYLVAVQLRDSSGNVVFEHADRPAKGTYPTKEWDTGEALLDWHDFDLPKDLAPGDYEITLALRDAADGRLLGQTTLCPISVLAGVASHPNSESVRWRG